jgi:hypothetical protein
MPVRLALVGTIAVSLLAPVLAPAALLVALLIVGLPSFGTLFTPAAALLSAGADRLQLNQALAFGLTNLAWASGQASRRGRDRRAGPGDLGSSPVHAARLHLPGDPGRPALPGPPPGPAGAD